MSKFEEQMDDCNRICPYCGHVYRVEAEDYDEDPRIEECEECGKKFMAYECFSVTHYAVPDCELNGLRHVFEGKENHNFRICKVCGKGL